MNKYTNYKEINYRNYRNYDNYDNYRNREKCVFKKLVTLRKYFC